MPLNHLGLKVRYQDIHRPLPDLTTLADVRGVLTWFEDDQNPDPEALVQWAEKAVAAGVRWVVLGDLGVHRNGRGEDTPTPLTQRYLALLGLATDGRWKTPTYDVTLVNRNAAVWGFEKARPTLLPPFLNVEKENPAVVTHLAGRWGKGGEHQSELVITGPGGGYAQVGMAAEIGEERVAWLVNPFEFFRLAYATDELPKPDTTTLSGRRIYYSHIDGDGWLNPTEIEKYPGALASRVILDEAILPYGDLPVTVSAIAGDLDPEWHGTDEARAIARDVFLLDHVEAASHTYSHPFDWHYFGNAYKPEDEWRAYWSRKPESNRWQNRYPQGESGGKDAPSSLKEEYDTPRAYGDFPFDLAREIAGSVRQIETLLPRGKAVSLMQWSGDTWVGAAALKRAAEAGLGNLNGGDTRMDSEHPSVGWVSPIGVAIGDQVQIYASASNENNYTHLWQDRFFGFSHVRQTFDNTEHPRRLKPMNIYYHMYSGQKEASLRALIGNLNHARVSEIAPVTASRYAAIARGFYSTELVRLDASRWQVSGHGALGTLRFDNAEAKAVDFARSQGVIGQRHHQGSLYVALDAAVARPIVAIKGHVAGEPLPAEKAPYLADSRWRVEGFAYADNGEATFTAQGYGPGTMRWRVNRPGLYRVVIESDEDTKTSITTKAGDDGLLDFTVNAPALNPVRITFRAMEEVL